MYYDEKLVEMNERLRVLEDGGKAVIWPCGRHTAELYFRSELSRYAGQLQFVDINQENRFFLGQTVSRPSEIKWEEISYVFVSTLRLQQEIALEAASQPAFSGEIIKLYEPGEVREFYLLYDKKHEISWGEEYQTWEEAEAVCAEGYKDKSILEACIRSVNGLKEKEMEPDYFCVSHILLACQRRKQVIIIDFGGGLGDEYFRNRAFLERVGVDYVWCIVEQKHYVSWGMRHLQSDRLRFFQKLDDVRELYGENHFIVYIRSSIQYLKDTYAVLEQCAGMHPVFIMIDETPVAEQEHIVIQETGGYVYEVKLPVRIIEEAKLLGILGSRGYHLTAYSKRMEMRFSNYKASYKRMAFQLEEKEQNVHKP